MSMRKKMAQVDKWMADADKKMAMKVSVPVAEPVAKFRVGDRVYAQLEKGRVVEGVVAAIGEKETITTYSMNGYTRTSQIDTGYVVKAVEIHPYYGGADMAVVMESKMWPAACGKCNCD